LTHLDYIESTDNGTIFSLQILRTIKKVKKLLKEKSQSSSLQVAENLLEGTTLLALDMGLYTSERQFHKDDQDTMETTSLLTNFRPNLAVKS